MAAGDLGPRARRWPVPEETGPEVIVDRGPAGAVTGPQGPTGPAGAALGPDLTAIEALAGTGLLARIADASWALRSIAVSGNGWSGVTNPAGIAGNPTLALSIGTAAGQVAAGDHAHAAAYEPLGAVAAHAAVTTGVHGLAITAGQTLTVTTGGTLGTAAYTDATAYAAAAHNHAGVYDPAGEAAGEVAAHELTYNHVNYNTAYGWGDHAGLYAPIAGAHAAVSLAASAAALLNLSTQELSLDTQAANLIFAGPVSGAAAAPTFRAMVAADLGTGLSPTFAGLTCSGLTASLPVVTDAGKALASMTYANFKTNLALVQADIGGLTTGSRVTHLGLSLTGYENEPYGAISAQATGTNESGTFARYGYYSYKSMDTSGGTYWGWGLRFNGTPGSTGWVRAYQAANFYLPSFFIGPTAIGFCRTVSNDKTDLIPTLSFDAYFSTVNGAMNFLFGGAAAGTSATLTYVQKAGTPPSTSPADAFQLYSADQAAGNACPHFRTENGGIVKLYTHVDARASAVANSGDATTDGLIDALRDAMISHGLIAAS